VEFIQANIMWVALAAISGGMLLWPLVASGGKGVSPQMATLMLNREDALMLDVREDGEWSSGHIPNARHVALAKLDGAMTDLGKKKDRPIVVCCASGNRSMMACSKLRKAGFEKVFNLTGGIGAWKDAGLPVSSK
jgi:rhodanese-related sulfurtransferase